MVVAITGRPAKKYMANVQENFEELLDHRHGELCGQSSCPYRQRSCFLLK